MEIDFTHPNSEDFEDWEDIMHDGWFYTMVEDILACYTGDTQSTDDKILALPDSFGDLTNAFEYFSTVVKNIPDAEDVTPEYLAFRERVVNLLNLFKPAE